MLLSFHLFMTSKPLNSHGVKSVSLRIQPECGKIRTRKNSVFGHFSRNNGVISSFNINVSKKKLFLPFPDSDDAVSQLLNVWINRGAKNLPDPKLPCIW